MRIFHHRRLEKKTLRKKNCSKIAAQLIDEWAGKLNQFRKLKEFEHIINWVSGSIVSIQFSRVFVH